MFRIGSFSQLTGVTVKTLRYYESVGLLQPAEVDRFTGYRSYTLDQMDRLNRIVALKDLGLTLDEIKRVLNDHPQPAELRGMLRLKRAQVRQSIAAEQARLERIEARLRLIESEGAEPVYPVIVRDVQAQDVLAYRQIVSAPPEIGPLIDRVFDNFTHAGLKPVAPCVALYYHGEYREHDLDFEIALPVDEHAPESLPLWEDRRMARQTLPAQRVAATQCRMESQIDVFLAYRDLSAWVAAHNQRIAIAPSREVYNVAPAPGEPTTFEVQCPLEP